jgi:DNA ligase-1
MKSSYIIIPMASSKRDFTKFDDFPGSLDEGTGFHILPTLWQKDGADRWRQWTIQTRLVKTDMQMNGIDWDLLVEKQVIIKPEYYVSGVKIPKGIQAEAWVETGIEGGKITRSAPTYFIAPVNEGKANERNLFQQSLVYARSQWMKKVDKGGVEVKPNILSDDTPLDSNLGDDDNINVKPADTGIKSKSKNNSTKSKTITKNTATTKSTIDTRTNVMYFPMLARPFKEGEKYLKYPIYVQPKLDGIRCISFLRKPDSDESEVIIYTRAKKPFPSVDYLKKVLYPYLNALYDHTKHQSIYLDGELYKHGKKLQDISGDSRNEKADESESNKNRNEYHIYDCFYPKELDTPFKNRLKQLVALYDSIDTEDSLILKKVPSYLVKSIEAAEKKYDELIKMGYEGAMLRNVAGPYTADPVKTGTFLRSHDLVKMKPKFTDEFNVVGFTEGSRGKDKGAIIWVCETSDHTQFNVTPKDITYEDRYALYADAVDNFEEKYKDRMMTVEYQDLSKTGVPLRAKAVTFRDYE